MSSVEATPKTAHTTGNGSSPVQTSQLQHFLKVPDHVPVGTKDILTSPHVSEGPGRIANSPVPSIFSDDRGEIHRLRVGHKRLNLLFSKKGTMRSGYLHPHVMKDFIVSGSVEVWTLTTEGTSKTTYNSNEFFTLDAYVPHILHFLEDSTVLEFWDGPFSCWYYHPYRRVVQLQNSVMMDDEETQQEKTTGLFQHLVPQDTPSPESSSSFFWAAAGLLVGVGIGVLAGRRK